MKLIAISFGISSSAREMIEKIGENIFHKNIEIIDLKSTEPKIDSTDALLIFGTKAARLLSSGQGQNQLELPDLKSLEPGNDKERQEANRLLTIFRNTIESQKTITTDMLSDIDSNNLSVLERRLKEKKENSWNGKLKDGRSIDIQLLSTESNADIAITFTELYVISEAMKILGVSELTLK